MNFNLQSDETNGYEFTPRFREDIQIPANAKAILNWATLSKVYSVNLEQDQKITFNAVKTYPSHVPGTGTELAPTMVASATIKAGNYSYDEFQTELNTALETIRTDATMGGPANPLLKYYNTNQTDIDPTKNEDVVCGYFLDNEDRWPDVAFTVDAANNFNQVSDPNGDVYQKAAQVGATPLMYDNYAISNVHYWHNAFKCDDQPENNNIIWCKTNVNMDAQIGSIFIGLYSREYINDPAVVAKIGGNNTPRIVQQRTTAPWADPRLLIPACFFGVEITTDHGLAVSPGRKLNIYAPFSPAPNNYLPTWNDKFQRIDRMSIRSSKPLTDYTANLTQHFEFGIQTYVSTNSNAYSDYNRKQYGIRLVVEENGQLKTIWDSLTGKDKFGFTEKFMTANTIQAPFNANRASSQIPFNVLLAAQQVGEGWEYVKYKGIDKTPAAWANTPSIILDSYNLTFGQELIKFVGTVTTPNLYPNTCEMNTALSSFYYIVNLAADWKNKSYSIEIENLPLKNYKNTAQNQNGGFAKNILAVLPVPFTNNVQQTTPTGSPVITGIFQPNQPIVNYLLNQPFKTNYFKIRIKNMDDDTPADDIVKSTINFTIMWDN